MSDAADTINQIIDNAIALAGEQTQAATEAAENLIDQSAGFYLPPPNSDTGFAVEAVEPDIPIVGDSLSTYEAQLASIIAMLSDQLAGFFNDYYPLQSDAFDDATNWLIDEITNGGTGINADVENALWQRARDRLIADGRSVEAQIAVGYSAKGYSMVAGAMLVKMDEARFERARNSGVASVEISAKQFDTEVESVKFAVAEALKSRGMAMQAAADYIRAIASAPASAVNAAELDTGAQAKMMAAAASWYGVRLDRDKIVLSSKLAEMGSRDDVYKHRRTNATQNSQVDVQALAAAADVFAKSAQAALTSLTTVVGNSVSSFA